jgi:hypothetical protein
MAAKTTCPISRRQFTESAQAVEVIINGVKMTAKPKDFSTGSLGWNISSKMEIEVAGKAVTVQVGLNLTIVGSKDLPRDPAAPTPAAEETPAAE